MTDVAHAGGHGFPWMLAMWSVMMVVMMTPSALPMIRTYDALRRGARQPVTQTATFVAAYLFVWLGFALLAAALQVLLRSADALDPMMRATPLVGGSLLLVTGAWQLMPLKDRCLVRCRSPIAFLMSEWRDGAAGALRMGTRHGAWCVGCCWALMLVLFAAGVMNYAWIALITAWVLLEKTLGGGRRLARIGGALALCGGGWLLVFGG